MRVRSWLLAVGAAMIATVLSVTPAYASNEVEVSVDGVTYNDSIPEALFSGMAGVVPGDTVSRTFFVRNTSGTAGTLRVSLYDVRSPNFDMNDALTVTTSTPQNPGAPVSLSKVDRCSIVVDGEALLPGGVVEVTVAVALGDLQGIDGQHSEADMAYRVDLTDAAAPRPAVTSCDLPPQIPVITHAAAPQEQLLEYTGAGDQLPTIAIASALLGAGWFFIIAAKRRKDRGEAPER